MIILMYIIIFIILWIYISFNYYNWKTNFELWQLKQNKGKIKISKSYKTFDEMQESLNIKYIWYKELYLIIKVRCEQFFDIPKDIYRFFKKGIQRWSRGWSDEDVWSIDYFLNSIIPPMLKKLKETKHGVPTVVGEMKTDKEFEEATKLWDSYLDKMIKTFEITNQIGENDLFYQKSENYSEEEARKFNNIWLNWTDKPKPRAMSKKECEEYEEGWKLFQEYYFSLWD